MAGAASLSTFHLSRRSWQPRGCLCTASSRPRERTWLGIAAFDRFNRCDLVGSETAQAMGLRLGDDALDLLVQLPRHDVESLGAALGAAQHHCAFRRGDQQGG
jgi:hypothetical protein